MIDNRQLSRDDLIDALLDLKHDLGKYIRLPVAMLPPNAAPDELRSAIDDALERTRRGPAGTRSAREIWRAFLDEAGAALERTAGLDPLTDAVERALALGATEAPLARAVTEATLGAVGERIQQLIQEVTGD